VHLVSTDPAHSVGHLFAQDLSGGRPAPSACAPALTLEEVDGAALGRAWFEEVGSAVAELVDRGTYLDQEDVRSLLGSSLPGMDEIMAAFRLVELVEDQDLRRIVVDTAPTGHLLRLLDSAEVVDGWSEALSAMAEKAGVVATRLAGRHVRLAGEAVLEDLRRQVVAFRQDLVGGADFIVVTRAGAVVAAETERLTGELTRRGCRVAAVVAGESAGESVSRRSDGIRLLHVPWTSERTGCGALRGWGAAAASAPARGQLPAPAPDDLPILAPDDSPTSAPDDLPAPPTGRLPASARDPLPTPVLRARPLDRPLLLFAGKGGVGKSTCAAAWAVHRAAGRPTLLLGADPAGSLADVFGMDAGAPSSLPPGLAIQQVDAEKGFARFKEEYRARIEDVFRGVGIERSNSLDRRVMASLLQMAPSGLDEIFALDALLDALDEQRDVILDGAPTGHFLRLMEMPDVASAWTRGVIRALLKYRVALGLDDVAERLLRLARRLRELQARLGDASTTGVAVVTTTGTLPVAETQRLLSRLVESDLPVAAVIHNRYSPGFARVAVGSHGIPSVHAPRLEAPPVGVGALRSFVSLWEWA
jgi:arsenite-transporting ATPase